MKDLTLNDIFPKEDQPNNRLVIQNTRGRWVFGRITTTPTVVGDGSYYYPMQRHFGVLKRGQRNPRRVTNKGVPGDYLVSDGARNLQVLSSSDFNKLYPKRLDPISVVTPPVDSTSIRDQKFYDKVAKQSVTPVYDNTPPTGTY